MFARLLLGKLHELVEHLQAFKITDTIYNPPSVGHGQGH